jgi:hypothetical protein
VDFDTSVARGSRQTRVGGQHWLAGALERKHARHVRSERRSQASGSCAIIARNLHS